VDITNPQTWNRYTYSRNNPLSHRDPLGLCDDGGGEDTGDAVAARAITGGHSTKFRAGRRRRRGRAHGFEDVDGGCPSGGFSGFASGASGGAGAGGSWDDGPGIGVVDNPVVVDDPNFGGSYTVTATPDDVPLASAAIAGAGVAGEGALQEGLTVGYGDSVFYAGYSDGALDVAETLGTPITSTPVGAVYGQVTDYLPAPVSTAGWNYLSGLYADAAEGPISVVIGQSATGGSVFWQTEFGVLVGNASVTDWAWILLP
jgi:hypothetical protein